MPKKKTSSPGTSLPESERPHQGPGRTDDLYRRFLDRSSDAVMLHDGKGRFIEVNEPFCRRLGYSRKELLAKTPMDINIQSETASILTRLRILHEQGRSSFETMHVHRNGHLIHTAIISRLITLQGKQLILSVARNIPEHDKGEFSPEQSRQFLSLSGDLIAFLDRDLVYRKVNQAFCRAHGRSVEQIVGTPAREFHDTPYFQETMEPGLTGCLQGRTMRVQAWTEFQGTGRRRMDITFYPFSEHGSSTVDGVVFSGHDITDLEGTAPAEPAFEQDRLESLLNNMPTGVYIIDRHFNLEYVNPVVQEEFGPLQMRERKCFHYLADRSDPCPWCKAGDIFARKRTARWSWHRRHADAPGQRTTYDVYAAPMADGNTTTMITWLYDVSHRQAAADRLQVLNEQLTTLINASPDGIFFKDGNGRWLLANRAGLRLFGLEDVEYFGKTGRDLARLTSFAAESLLACEESDETAWQKGEIACFDTLFPMADGSSRTYEVVKAPLFHKDGSRKALIVLSRDISKRVETERALRSEMEKRREANISMRVLLDQYREARQEVEQQITAQLKKLVFPYLDLLEQNVRQEQAREHLKIIGSHLAAITDPFARKLSDPLLGLTPREMLVADLVRQGKSSAAIARALNLSKRTIDAYRNSLRKKLRLTNKKVNLREHLRSAYSLSD